MKKIINLLGIVALIATYSCSPTYQAGNNKIDDVYYSSKNHPEPVSTTYSDNNQNNSESYQNTNPENTTQSDYVPADDNSTYQQSSDSKGNTYITNNYNGDYYDYEYSSRIRRYYEPVYGYSYYDPYYTNSYWYNYNPYSWGVSIYLGYNWWAPSTFYYDPFCYGGFSIGFGYSPYWGYHPYSYGGYYGGYYGCNYYSPYYNGYNQGYWNGYHDGYYGYSPNPYYYNSYDATSYYYGPRGSVSSNSPRSASQRQGNIAPLSEKYEQAISDGRVSRLPDNDEMKSDFINRDRNNSIKETTSPQISKGQNSRNQTGTEKTNTDQPNNSNTRNNSTDTKPSNSNDIKPVNNQSKNNSTKNNSDTRNTFPDNRWNEIPVEKSKSILEFNNESSKITKDQIINNPKPDAGSKSSKSNLNIKDQNRSKQNTKENQRINLDELKNESPVKEENFLRKKDSKIDMPSRQENKTPVFTPRDQPKQYRQESSPQRSQPSSPPQNNNNSGRRK